MELCRYAGIEANEKMRERIFKKYDTDGSGHLDYAEFKQKRPRLTDIREQCRAHGIPVKSWIQTKSELGEAHEAPERGRNPDMAIYDAERWLQWREQRVRELEEKGQRIATREYWESNAR